MQELVDLTILGTGSFRMSWSRTEVYRSSRYRTTFEKFHQKGSLGPSSELGTYLQHGYSTENQLHTV